MNPVRKSLGLYATTHPLSHTRRRWKLGLRSLERSRLRGTSWYEYMVGAAKKIEPGSSLQWPVAGQKATSTRGNRRNSTETYSFLLWGWSDTGTGCPERLWGCSKPCWTATCCRWPCPEQRLGLDQLQRCLPASGILWFSLCPLFFHFTPQITKLVKVIPVSAIPQIWGHMLMEYDTDNGIYTTALSDDCCTTG